MLAILKKLKKQKKIKRIHNGDVDMLINCNRLPLRFLEQILSSFLYKIKINK